MPSERWGVGPGLWAAAVRCCSFDDAFADTLSPSPLLAPHLPLAGITQCTCQGACSGTYTQCVADSCGSSSGSPGINIAGDGLCLGGAGCECIGGKVGGENSPCMLVVLVPTVLAIIVFLICLCCCCMCAACSSCPCNRHRAATTTTTIYSTSDSSMSTGGYAAPQYAQAPQAYAQAPQAYAQAQPQFAQAGAQAPAATQQQALLSSA